MNAKTRQIGRKFHRRWLVGLAPALALALTLTLGSSFGAQAAERVYKWTDENGTVHFTSTPPPGSQAERVKLRKAPPAPPSNDSTSASASQGELYAESDQPDNSAIEEENRRIQCQKGRNMIAQIEPRPRVFRVEEDGSRTYLLDEEREELLTEARDLVAEHCDS